MAIYEFTFRFDIKTIKKVVIKTFFKQIYLFIVRRGGNVIDIKFGRILKFKTKKKEFFGYQWTIFFIGNPSLVKTLNKNCKKKLFIKNTLFLKTTLV